MTLFLSQLWALLNDPKCTPYVSWNAAGNGFFIHDVPTFENRVLVTYYKHNRYSSFLRSLSYYSFVKVVLTDQVEYVHPIFRRGHPECLSQIVRKPTTSSRHPAGSAGHKAVLAAVEAAAQQQLPPPRNGAGAAAGAGGKRRAAGASKQRPSAASRAAAASPDDEDDEEEEEEGEGGNIGDASPEGGRGSRVSRAGKRGRADGAHGDADSDDVWTGEENGRGKRGGRRSRPGKRREASAVSGRLPSPAAGASSSGAPASDDYADDENPFESPAAAAGRGGGKSGPKRGRGRGRGRGGSSSSVGVGASVNLSGSHWMTQHGPGPQALLGAIQQRQLEQQRQQGGGGAGEGGRGTGRWGSARAPRSLGSGTAEGSEIGDDSGYGHAASASSAAAYEDGEGGGGVHTEEDGTFGGGVEAAEEEDREEEEEEAETPGHRRRRLAQLLAADAQQRLAADAQLRSSASRAHDDDEEEEEGDLDDAVEGQEGLLEDEGEETSAAAAVPARGSRRSLLDGSASPPEHHDPNVIDSGDHTIAELLMGARRARQATAAATGVRAGGQGDRGLGAGSAYPSTSTGALLPYGAPFAASSSGGGPGGRGQPPPLSATALPRATSDGLGLQSGGFFGPQGGYGYSGFQGPQGPVLRGGVDLQGISASSSAASSSSASSGLPQQNGGGAPFPRMSPGLMLVTGPETTGQQLLAPGGSGGGGPASAGSTGGGVGAGALGRVALGRSDSTGSLFGNGSTASSPLGVEVPGHGFPLTTAGVHNPSGAPAGRPAAPPTAGVGSYAFIGSGQQQQLLLFPGAGTRALESSPLSAPQQAAGQWSIGGSGDRGGSLAAPASSVVLRSFPSDYSIIGGGGAGAPLPEGSPSAAPGGRDLTAGAIRNGFPPRNSLPSSSSIAVDPAPSLTLPLGGSGGAMGPLGSVMHRSESIGLSLGGFGDPSAGVLQSPTAGGVMVPLATGTGPGEAFLMKQ